MRNDAASPFAELSGALWRQRENLETLLFRLVAEQSIVSGGQLRWLARADDDVRRAVEALRLGEVMRAIVVEQVANAVGLGSDATLAVIAERAPEPWCTLLAEHRTALRELTLLVQGLTAENLRLLDAGAKAVRETLDHLAATVATYDSTGASVVPPRPSLLLDEQA